MMKWTTVLLVTVLIAGFILLPSCKKETRALNEENMSQQPEKSDPIKTVDDAGAKVPLYAFEMNTIDGESVKLADYQGKSLLIVNVASKCGYTRQYTGLQKVYEKYKDKDFLVLAFPANNFGSQEPGSNEEIKEFCTSKFKVSFPMFAKISVKGKDMHPLYQYLTSQSIDGATGDIKWNFNKFLIDKTGKIVGRYESKMEPAGPELTAAIEATL